ncbi:MAG: phosphoribosylformylglycinamidine synthase subunit PurS [Abditibacteriota bacterium]|nr:phosphoribosylformylglycinamidine synthase subunit PurS [Abditibacteriota bacterium]
MYRVKVYVTLKPSLLDAQGKVVKGAAVNLGYDEVENVRIGKFIELSINENTKDVNTAVEELCSKLLANTVIENYKYEIEKE